LPRISTSVSSLYERTPEFEAMVKAGVVDPRECETTLAEVITELGLTPLSVEDEQKIRDELGAVIGRGIEIFEQSAKQNPDGKLTVSNVQVTLTQVADGLDAMIAGRLDPDQFVAIDKLMKRAETGFRENHDTEVALKIRSALAREIGVSNAHDRMAEFQKWPRTIAEACRRAARDLDLIEGAPGRQSRDWYRDFKRVLTLIAKKNAIPPKVVINRRTHEARGRFIELAEQFERLLPRHMRSQSREAMAKMLERVKVRQRRPA
jgi:hypothetical protein